MARYARCEACGARIWFMSTVQVWTHQAPPDGPHTAVPAKGSEYQNRLPPETNFEPDADAERADERSKELRFGGPLEDPPEDDHWHGVDFARTEYAEWPR